jgi:hypothetical protein
MHGDRPEGAGQDGGVRPAAVIVDPPVEGLDLARIEGGFLDGLADSGRLNVLGAVSSTARERPGAALVHPVRAPLQDDPQPVGDQQARGPEASPVSVAERAQHPAVAVTDHGRPVDSCVSRE